MLDQLTVLITYLIVVSIAAERATDIFKRAFVLKFKVENFNGALYQFTAGVFGTIIAYFDKPSFDFITTSPRCSFKGISTLFIPMKEATSMPF